MPLQDVARHVDLAAGGMNRQCGQQPRDRLRDARVPDHVPGAVGLGAGEDARGETDQTRPTLPSA